jgi:hypothetical protein
MQTISKKTAVQKYREIDSLIGSASNLSDCEKKELSKENLWALLSNIEIVQLIEKSATTH